MNEADRIRLQHMLEAAHAARFFAVGRQREDLDTDRQLAFALVKAIEIVEEAAARVSEEAREEYAEVPWSQIIGMRNVLVHVYFDIDHDQLWETVMRDLPPLIDGLERVLGD